MKEKSNIQSRKTTADIEERKKERKKERKNDGMEKRDKETIRRKKK